MLEYNFNSLDDDFITLWSQYLLYNDTAMIIKPLQELAEKGQVNAIQSWYLLKKPEEQNATIDAIVDGYYGDSFNESLAITNRLYSQNKQQINDLRKEIHNKAKLKDEHIEKFGHSSDWINQDLNQMINQYLDTEYAKQHIKTLHLAELTATSLNSATAWQRLYELCLSDHIIYAHGDYKITGYVNHIRVKKLLRTELEQRFADEARIKYALGKNLFFFANNKKENQEGREILLELSKRPLKHVSNETSLAEEERM